MNWKDAFKNVLIGTVNGFGQGLQNQTGPVNWQQAGIVAGFSGLIALIGALSQHPAVQPIAPTPIQAPTQSTFKTPRGFTVNFHS